MRVLKVLLLLVFIYSCQKDIASNGENVFNDEVLTSSQTISLNEGFENGTKNSYSGDYVQLNGSDWWYLSDALLGSLSNDRKEGSKSIRMRNTGYAEMDFDLSNGVSTVEIKHAKYGSDGSSTWELSYSTNGGSSWTKAGTTVTTSSTSLQNVTFNININGSVRFLIEKKSGGSNRINFDTFIVYEYNNSGGGGGGSGSATTENFETGSKGSYGTGNVTLSTGAWTFSNALLGTLSSDRKNGSKSARIRGTGYIQMNFDLSNGANTVEVKHAKFGSDGSSLWKLQYSTNSGSSWVDAGSSVTTNSTSLQTASFTINQSGSVRFKIVKLNSGSRRINIDDFSINGSGSGGGGGGGTPPATVHLTFGNPSNAVNNVTATTNYLMIKNGYALSYNEPKAIPNWVSWHLDQSWTGSTSRQNDYRKDPALPSGWNAATGGTFGGGFDRGHMTPSADRTSSVSLNSETFLMTNFLPQASNNNQGPWVKLESYLRSQFPNEMYVIAGGHGSQGTTSKGGNVTIPVSTWKVVLILSSGSNDVSRVTTSTKTIAVIIPNNNTISRSSGWRSYQVTVDQVESLTGYNFFSEIPDNIESVIEARKDSF